MKSLALVAALVTLASADPKVQIGERRFTGGAAVTAIAVCSPDRALSVEMYGPRTYQWKLPGGELAGTLGTLDKEQGFVACEGDLALAGNFEQTTLYRGSSAIASAPIKDAIGGTIAGGRAYVFADGTLYELSAAGPKPLWKASEQTGFRAVVRADLVVTWDADGVVWSTAKRTTRIAMPAEVVTAADVGDGIAIVDKRGDARVLTEPKLPAVIAHVDPEKLGDIRSIGGNRAWLAVGTYDAKLVQIARKTGKALPPLELVPPRMSRGLLAIAVAGERWLVGTDDNRIVPVALGATSFTRPAIAGHDQLIWALAFDATSLVSGSSDDTVRVHALDGKLLREMENAESRPYSSVGLTPDLIWARDDYDHLQRWWRKKKPALPTIESIGAAAALDGKRLAVMHRGALGVLDLASGTVRPVPGSPPKVSDAKLAAAGNLVAMYSGTFPGPLLVVDVTSGTIVASLAIAEIDAIAFTADASRLAISADRKIQIWTRAGGKLTAGGEHPKRISSLAFAADGRLASGDWNGTIRIWAPGVTKPTSEIAAHLGRIDALVWKGKQLASAASDYQVKVWDVP